MKRWLVLCGFILIIGVLIVIGIKNFNNKNNIYEEQPYSEKELAQNINYNEINIVSTSANEEKVSPNALINLETYYKKCKHTEIERINANTEFVNMTKEEIKKKFDDWDVISFNANELTLRKETEGICNEHYLLKENNGYISIYTLDEVGRENLKETTGIVVRYLTQTDIEQLQKGIRVYGRENLNAKLEDYE